MITLTQEAARIATERQMRRIAALHGPPDLAPPDRKLVVGAAGFDLPTGYLYFRLLYGGDGGELYGGIDPDGQAST